MLRWRLLVVVFVAAHALFINDAQACIVKTSDYCVTCSPGISKMIADFCPGGDAGLIILKAQNQGCAVQFFDARVCGAPPAPPQSGAGGIGPYDLMSTNDQVTSIVMGRGQRDRIVAYRPGKGASAVISVNFDGSLTSTAFNRPDTGQGPFGIGSFDLRMPQDRVVALGGRLLFAYRPGQGDSAVVRLEGDHFDSLLQGRGVGGFDLKDERDQVVALAPALLFAYRPGSGESAVISFDGTAFHSLLQGRGIGSFDLRDRHDRVVALGNGLALAYRPGPVGRSWAVVSFDLRPTPHFNTLETRANEGVGSFDLQSELDTIVALPPDPRVLAFRPGGAEAAVALFSTEDLRWHTLFTGHTVGAFDLKDQNDRVVSIGPALLLAYRAGRGAATVVRFRFDGVNGKFDTLFDRPDAAPR